MGHVNMHHGRGQAGENRQRYFIYRSCYCVKYTKRIEQVVARMRSTLERCKFASRM